MPRHVYLKRWQELAHILVKRDEKEGTDTGQDQGRESVVDTVEDEKLVLKDGATYCTKIQGKVVFSYSTKPTRRTM